MKQDLEYYLTKTYYPLLIAISINVLIHLPFMFRAPEGIHVWRQSNTLAIARNFYTEEMNILEPRVDNRFDKSGVTGANFPLYEYGLACLYKVLGEHDFIHRFYSLIIFITASVGLYFWVNELFKNRIIASVSAIAFLYFPDLFYFEIVALPDVLALALVNWGMYFFMKFYNAALVDQEFSKINLLSLIICLTFAGLVKLYFLLVGFFIVGLLIKDFKQVIQHKLVFYLLGIGVVVVSFPLAWYSYAQELIKKSGLTDFGLEIRSEKNLIEIKNILLQNITSDLPELILNYANTTLLVIAIGSIFKFKLYRKKCFIPFVSIAVGIMAYHLIELKQMKYHSYYMFPYYAFLAMVVGYGGFRLFKFNATFLLIVLIANPIVASIRILPSRWLSSDYYMPTELHDQNIKEKLINAVPDTSLCIVGPDESNCIFFYALRKKGFSVSNINYLFEKTHGQLLIENYTQRGAQYIYLYRPTAEQIHALKPFVIKLLVKEGEFWVWELKR